MKLGRWSLALGLAAGVACSSGERAPKGGDAADPVVARVGSKTITSAQLDEIMRSLPATQQGEFAGTRGRMRLLDHVVRRDLMILAAEDAGLEREPAVAKRLQDFRNGLLAQAYQDHIVASMPEPSEAALRAYYDGNQDEFRIMARVNASWIVCKTKKEAEAARKRIVEGGEEFHAVARQVSIHAETKVDGGLLGYFNPIGYVRGIGNRPDFAPHAFDLEAGDIGEVFPWDGSFAFVKVHEKTTERTEPFDAARERILARVKPALTDSLIQAEVEALKAKHKVEILIDVDKELEDKSADEIMRLATEAQNPMDKIEYYRALLRKYPQYERAAEAQFMIAFTFSEELRNYKVARAEFDKVLKDYPNSDIRESAAYMIHNLESGSPLPDFGDVLPPPASQP